jgi:signal transduction histidine kinase
MRLRSSLLMLSVGTAAPLLAVAIVAAAYVFESENTTFVNAALTRNRATLQAVDAELSGTVNTLRALGSSEALARRDFTTFHREANIALATQPSWLNIVLLTPQGSQLVNARLPWGAALPKIPVETRTLRTAVTEVRAAISDITLAPLLKNEPGIAVRWPVSGRGDVLYVLTAVINPSVFQRILEDQRLPLNWMSGIVGTDDRLIARVPSVPPGTLAGANYREALTKAVEGWYRGRTLEGEDVYTAFTRSDLTGWSIGLAIPSEAIMGGPYRAAAMFAAGLLVSILSALLIAYWLGRRIALPIAALAGAARHLGTGRLPKEVDSTIEEVVTLARAFREADCAIDERDRELVRRGDELARQAEELRQIDANKTRYLALISHELRGPLGPLRNGLQLLERIGDPQKQAEVRSMMNRQLAMLERLVGDLVDMGRIGRGELELRLQPVPLDDIVHTSIESVRPQIEEKNQSLQLRLTSRSLLVNGDVDRLRQVVVNLLSNASRYTPKGGHITLGLAQVDSEAVLVVSDDGVGLTPADCTRIFDMFVRLAPAGSGPAGSLGIGLAVTRAIVEMHHGRIEVASAGLGQGTTFRVYLPSCGSTQEPEPSAFTQVE